MPKQQRRTFTSEFKKQMVGLYEKGNPEQRLWWNMTSQPPL
ncbi:hypothetical protein BBR47_07150 [Brevibacillus brevis NBRC 100599]|uniref:Transposase n=1 Tax=Brevibacillus brevis (strain 47 / JCM 6285 / NBRC 100599) TaxID=358681 RepID=C0Z4G5_BREBN|nr:hypothetical protein BBR47_07150 [Brevibacillus brevis NBRC 100599]